MALRTMGLEAKDREVMEAPTTDGHAGGEADSRVHRVGDNSGMTGRRS